MRTLALLLIVFLGISVRVNANPITPEALITEVYWLDGEWNAVVDCFLMDMLGIETFQDVDIYCNDGYFHFKEDFLPDFNTWHTVITNDALIYPLELNPVEEDIYIFYDGWFDIMDLHWGDSPYDDVSGPGEGQSLVVDFVWGDENWNYTFWLVKANEPCDLSWDCVTRGVFNGFLLDNNNIPIPNAEIRYVSDYLMQAFYIFPQLITDETGYFCHDYLFARNYHLYKVVIDGTEYDFNEYVSIEPETTNTFTFNLDITMVPENPDPSFAHVANFPNPFSTQTTFVIDMPERMKGNDMSLKILDMLGRMANDVNIDVNTMNEGRISLIWKNNLLLGSGNYIALLTANGAVLATNKISIK
jgi:hypothetical protein